MLKVSSMINKNKNGGMILRIRSMMKEDMNMNKYEFKVVNKENTSVEEFISMVEHELNVNHQDDYCDQFKKGEDVYLIVDKK